MVATDSPPGAADVLDVLQDRFGFDALRDGQRPVIDRLLAGRSTLAIFPTGAGKSLCYQLPALMLDGLTLVVSPLIALMKDQIDFLTARGIAAARLDSSVEAPQAQETYRGLREGALKLLYVAPERLANERFLQTLSRLRVAMLAVDEAHCISEWGHNFRPDYLKLANLARRLNVGRVLALTATATPPVAKQIAAAFAIAEGDVVRTGFYRPNLSLAVTPAPASKRDGLLLERLRRRPPGPTIVYVTLQKTAERVADLLRGAGFDALAYHAGMEADARHAAQERFMQSPRAIVVATIAFGMGIDKRDIRYVYHYNLPKSIENYAQEIGRAGRDGAESVCEVFACGDDPVVLENFTFGDTPEPGAVEAIVAEVLGLGEAFDVSVSDLSSRHDVRPLVVETLLTYLQLLGVIESTGAFYDTYKLRWLRPQTQVLAKFDRSRADFLRKVLSRGKQGKTWLTLEAGVAAAAAGADRQRVVAALTYLDEQGDVELQAVGVRNGFRGLPGAAAAAGDVAALAAKLNDRFQNRETRDLERLQAVVDFCEAAGCRTRRLLAYFGEPVDADCGHCADCRRAQGAPSRSPAPTPLPAEQAPLRPKEVASLAGALREAHPAAFSSPRRAARFLCGISSPALVRAKLTRNERFGHYGDVPFREVFAAVASAWGHSPAPPPPRAEAPRRQQQSIHGGRRGPAAASPTGVNPSASSPARRASAAASAPLVARGSPASARRG